MKNNKKSCVCMGFVIKNSGIIEKCYSYVDIHSKSGGAYFAYENSNLIRDNMFLGEVKKQKRLFEFVLHNRGRVFSSKYRLNAENGKRKEINVNLSDVKWEKNNTRIDELKKYRNTLSDVVDFDGEIIDISTGSQLLGIIDKINSGDKEAATAHYKLVNNIDLQGITIPPIGISADIPFCGVFDGNRYVISNFKIKNKNDDFTAFFGTIRNAVIVNLGLSCKVKSGTRAASFVGYNDGGQIICCHAFADIYGGEMAAGFACVNNGYITKSSARGKVKPCITANKTIIIAPVACLLLALILTQLFLHSNAPQQLFPPLPKDDPGASLDKNDNESAVSGVNQASFEFSKNVIFKDKIGYFKLKNPGTSNKIIVLEIQITDEELLSKIGKTGRTDKQIAQIEKSANYDPSLSRMVIAKSGAIRPKYYLENLKLESFPDGSFLPKGTYNGIAYLKFYDIVTNECSIVNTQLPVTILVN